MKNDYEEYDDRECYYEYECQTGCLKHNQKMLKNKTIDCIITSSFRMKYYMDNHLALVTYWLCFNAYLL
ncbi:hypothetical protein ENUP19_0036G0047 [Entamoeba nuttalli]|uniref:Uncharacterized protein n=1 Tax=Entamoeba nuttalli TaxID=412467 RepID=A0ABQ0D9F4_9EUKA